MFKRLNPDVHDDIGDLISDLDDVCAYFLNDRELPEEEICYGLLFLGMSRGIQGFKNLRDIKALIKIVWDLTLNAYEIGGVQGKDLRFD